MNLTPPVNKQAQPNALLLVVKIVLRDVNGDSNEDESVGIIIFWGIRTVLLKR